MPNQDKLTPAQKNAIAEILLSIKRFIFSPPGNNDAELAKDIVEKIDAAQDAFDE